MNTAIYPGSFDPVTRGHMDMIRRAAAICDELVVAAMYNPAKTGLFPPEIAGVGMESIVLPDSVKRLGPRSFADCKNLKNVKICISSGLLSDIIKEEGCDAIVRGVRNLSDYEAERDRAVMNKQLSGVDTILLYAGAEYLHVSSSVVRELMHFDGDISGLIPAEILEDVQTYKKNSKA